MKLTLHQFDLKLRHTFTVSRESYDIRQTLIVELAEDGLRGYGEATAHPYYGITIKNMTAQLDAVRSRIESQSLEDPADLWQQLDEALGHNRFAQCALDEAAHDLWGKKLGKPVFELWGLSANDLPISNYTIGIDDIDTMVAKLREFPDWPVYKIKLGTDHDIDIVRELRKHTEARFRVDANCGWTGADETIANSRELKKLNVEFIEQPLPNGAIDEMSLAYSHAELPIIADESCQVESDVQKCNDEYFHGVNIKLVKCGGLTPARRMIQRAREIGMFVMVGCMTESTVGISAIAQLLPLLDYVDMDGATLLAEDIATGVTVEKGVCRYPTKPGCGVELL